MDGLLRNCATGCRVDEAFTMDDLVDSISADTSGLRCGPVEDRIHHAGMDGLLRNCGTGCRVATKRPLLTNQSTNSSGRMERCQSERGTESDEGGQCVDVCQRVQSKLISYRKANTILSDY
ncbi:hypothetical protein DPX16_17774 [Anabarilius grahami]|uniref:Uncharacterized protein n=1 Tax=Anabarilius grahami TaxID=495550 RepID=A0A3N0YIP4_ANAGA|nr:hypothetical protein DPX16_17774 [Anabarilius grahami]